MADPRMQVARLCEELPFLHQRAAQNGASADLEAIVRDVCQGEDVSDDFMELCRRLGIPLGPGTREPTFLPGLGSGRPTDDVLVCPQDLCARVCVREPGTSIPTCWITRAPLRYDEG